MVQYTTLNPASFGSCCFQNGGIAFVVLNLTFESPYSDVGVIPVLAFFFCSTGPIMFVVYALYEAYRFDQIVHFVHKTTSSRSSNSSFMGRLWYYMCSCQPVVEKTISTMKTKFLQ